MSPNRKKFPVVIPKVKSCNHGAHPIGECGILHTSEYSFGYISGWSGDKEVSELKENLDIIKQTADKISLSIEECVKKLKKDRDMYQMVSEDRLQYAEPNHKKR